MPIPVYFTLLNYNDSGIKNAIPIIRRNVAGTLQSLGKTLKESAQRNMRRDKGDEQRSLRVMFKASGLDMSILVYSVLTHAFVDALGLAPGTFPNSRRLSPLWNWAKRKYKGIESKEVRYARGRPKKRLEHRNRVGKAKRINRKSSKNAPRPTIKNLSKAKARDIDRLAFVFARLIYERGIRPTQWNKKALDQNRGAIMRDIKDALDRSVNEINRGTAQ